jgi:class 3 adenylate cyclase
VGAAQTAPVAERRLVSVLFADLGGFTTLSEARDAEEVRELLSRYFESCKRLISLYGGTVEKFIGDAVMAVWGTPTAQEDDAERAVRAALDLVAMVSALGQESGAELRARAGILTGEAAVTLGAEGEGMVAGDLVNSASRIQSAAEPGNVFVGERTRRASEAAIAYENAGNHELKGKAEPVPLFRALRVTAGRAGALKSERLEPPSSAGSANSCSSKNSSMPRPRRRRRTSSRLGASPGSASRASPGSSRSTSTASSRLQATRGGQLHAGRRRRTRTPTPGAVRSGGCCRARPGPSRRW